MEELDRKVVERFPGRIVRKDLTAKMKRGLNVPTYVLEYLLGMYCATDDEAVIEAGTAKIANILSENYIHPGESEKIKSRIRETGQYTVIDKITVTLDEREDCYVAHFTNLGVSDFVIASEYVVANTKLLAGGVWCISRLQYESGVPESDRHGKRRKYSSPFKILSLKPIQMPNLDLDEFIEARSGFTTEEWIDLLLRSEGYEPDCLSQKEKYHFLLRLVPLAEKNYNLVELGPRGTGKSHVYQELSPYAILMSGGQTTVSNLFYNMASRRVGLVGHWDCIAFDEVAGIPFRDTSTIQVLKNYMANGAFARGADENRADASICFEGNINDSVRNILKTTNLFQPFPEEVNNDSAFFDRIHAYLPGWEIPKLRSELLTERYGLITDCLSEFCHEMRKKDFTMLPDRYFSLNGSFNKRDEIAVRKTFSGMMKLIHPNGEATRGEVEQLLRYAIECRRRVKEQLRLIAGVEFMDTALGFVDTETGKETVVEVPEQAEDTLIPEGAPMVGHVYAVGKSMESGDAAIYRLENKKVSGNGKMDTQGVPMGARAVNESIRAAKSFFDENARNVIPGARPHDYDWLLSCNDLQDKGVSAELSVAEFVGLCSALAGKPISESTVIAGEVRLSGTMTELNGIEELVRVSINAGAKRILLPMDSMGDYRNLPNELKTEITPLFYIDPVNAAKMALEL